MKIAIGSDHGGFMLKQELIKHLKNKKHNVLDVGCFSQESCDYPEYSYAVAELVAGKRADMGIAICKSGIGNSIVANKVKGIRAALCHNISLARSSRAHNNANVLILGALYLKKDMAKRIVSTWLGTKFLGGRHSRRLEQVKLIERKTFRRP
jgi:ribose 5-phosphate isomerase B